MSKKKLISNSISILSLIVSTGILATLLGEKIGYSHLLVFLFTKFLYEKVNDYLKGRIK